MPRRYNYNRRRTNTRRDSGYGRRTMMKPGVQITIILFVALVIFIILQGGGGGGENAAALPPPDQCSGSEYHVSKWRIRIGCSHRGGMG
jgi:hypothetical protein